MRRRSLTVACSVALLLAAPASMASLEADCYVAGGYFGPTYFAASYFDETCTPSGGDPPSPVSGGNMHKHTNRFPGPWR